MRKYDLVIFDMDGTILNTLDDINNAVNAALSKYGYPLKTIDETRKNVGNGLRKTLERSFAKMPQESEFEEILKDMLEYYSDHSADNTRPYDGINELIADIREAGYLTAVISNKKDSAVQDLCEEYFKNLFVESIGERQGQKLKPAPDAIYDLTKRLNISLSRTIYIGDSDVDLATAANANIDCIAVTWGFRDEEFLVKNGAKIIAHNPDDVRRILL